ncbi:nucleoside diphosphate kinase regulator [Vibrio navarrensis]|uniref:Nucleoside diphosphate kinase regulator n=1 Tax=Vibrio navarrensis TaxID=29495 RepID=A0A099MED1_9VIBR|nr:nucleoside diphosphate kinase regulator [Vibrio navarrensis]EJK2113398.1 nucleoside diphosphate kinase regulator [Vibrio navarrensis]KGK11635.1 nucleoside diphosphate kinase regulator [Vibrio navarrensis]KGK18086.1 nucleoside diphosphate kinase regulator [Vibrio navarrensis]MBE3667103.1 nucleoside diphosphate kinase regulator [Vibrio navarrensis]MBE4573097.1 nucleoside diphosphate kinase regulator [Vibrio navarrensis]
MTNKPSIIVSTLDMDRISTLLEKATQWSAVLEKLEDELDRATVMASSDMPSDVVTMNSTVCFKFVGSDNSMEKTLVYPDQVRSSEDISIFAPVGSALLGLSVGQQLTWPMPGGQEKTIEIIDVVYQPERAGDFHL